MSNKPKTKTFQVPSVQTSYRSRPTVDNQDPIVAAIRRFARAVSYRSKRTNHHRQGICYLVYVKSLLLTTKSTMIPYLTVKNLCCHNLLSTCFIRCTSNHIFNIFSNTLTSIKQKHDHSKFKLLTHGPDHDLQWINSILYRPHLPACSNRYVRERALCFLR